MNKLKKIEDGPYKGQYVSKVGVIYNEELARKMFPQEFESTKPAVKKKSAKKRTK